MIRCYFGAGLLAALLFLCLGSTWLFTRQQSRTLELTEQAWQAAEAGDWDTAEEKARQARQHWDRSHRISAVLTDHCALEKGEEAFVQAQDSRDVQDYYQLYQALVFLLREHRLTLENIF